MDKWDRDNLEFLLSIDEATFDDFMAQSSEDDIQYAIELIQTHKAELMEQEFKLEEALLEEMGIDLSAAQSVLARFRL